MGIFKKAEKEIIYDDYDDESYRDEELLELSLIHISEPTRRS